MDLAGTFAGLGIEKVRAAIAVHVAGKNATLSRHCGLNGISSDALLKASKEVEVLVCIAYVRNSGILHVCTDYVCNIPRPTDLRRYVNTFVFKFLCLECLAHETMGIIFADSLEN